MSSKKLWFGSDYQEFAHEKILQRMLEVSRTHHSGYGHDDITASATDKIRKAIANEEADIVFLTGGTQTNQTIIDTMCAPYEGVIAAETGHVSVHEAGAIEFSGHKVLTLPSHEGKIHADELCSYIDTFYADANHDHMVFPGMVYISHPTEYGTLYTTEELKKLHEICEAHKIPLFLDGARLGYALAAARNSEEKIYPSLPEIAANSDVFYIGGTKVGALYGEAVVFTQKNQPAHFETRIKQHGALLAKGFACALQFDELFTDDLYQKISQNAVTFAMEIKQALTQKGYRLYLDSPTNQQFFIVPNDMLDDLSADVVYGYMERYDENHTVIRFCTSWATTKEDVDALLAQLPPILSGNS